MHCSARIITNRMSRCSSRLGEKNAGWLNLSHTITPAIWSTFGEKVKGYGDVPHECQSLLCTCQFIQTAQGQTCASACLNRSWMKCTVSQRIVDVLRCFESCVDDVAPIFR